MSFLPSSTIFGRITRQSVFHPTWLNTKHVRRTSRTAEAYAETLTKEETKQPPASFESLGLGVPFIQALQRAYPKVKTPTDIQTQLIPAVLGTQDIFLKDVTGSGKCVVFFFSLFLSLCSQPPLDRSFGLILGLINKPRLVSTGWKDGKEIEKRHITTIYLVPHRDLAYQLYRWIERIIKTLPKTRIASIAYVLVRGTGIPIERRVKQLEDNPPHIVICTPNGLMDAYKENRRALNLSTLSTIVVDEVDHVIKTVPRKDRNKSYRLAHEKAEKKVARHPGQTRYFLDAVYRREWNERHYSSEQSEGEERKERRKWKTPQLILSSATLHVSLKNYLFEASGWLNGGNLVKISRDDERNKSEGKKTEPTGKQGTVLHSVVVVGEGKSKNIDGAKVVPELKWTEGEAGVEAEVDECYDERE